MREIAFFLMGTEKKIFEAQGRRGGGSWAPDTPSWANRKFNLGLDYRINIARGNLMKSMTVPQAAGQVLHIGDRNVSLGSNLPYAAITEENRPFARLTAADIDIMRMIVKRYIISRYYA
jgi:phage gpG-like protein